MTAWWSKKPIFYVCLKSTKTVTGGCKRKVALWVAKVAACLSLQLSIIQHGVVSHVQTPAICWLLMQLVGKYRTQEIYHNDGLFDFNTVFFTFPKRSIRKLPAVYFWGYKPDDFQNKAGGSTHVWKKSKNSSEFGGVLCFQVLCVPVALRHA